MDKTIKIWNVENGNCIQTLTGHENAVFSVCISQDNRWIVSGSADETIKIWNVENGNCIQTLTGHTHWVHSVSISQDDQWIISAGSDRSLRNFILQTQF